MEGMEEVRGQDAAALPRRADKKSGVLRPDMEGAAATSMRLRGLRLLSPTSVR